MSKVLIGVVGATVVVGAGAFAAARVLGGSDASDIAKILPDNTVAYVSVNLDPSFDQKVKFARLLNAVAEAGGAEDSLPKDDDYLAKAVDEILQTCDLGTVDTATLVGDRAAAAVIPSGDDAAVLVYVEAGDSDAAQSFAEENAEATCEEGTELRTSFLDHDGQWLVFNPVDDEAVSMDAPDPSAEDFSPLADNERHEADMSDVGDQGVATFWINGTSELVKKVLDIEETTGVQLSMSASIYGTLRAGDETLELFAGAQADEDSASGDSDDVAGSRMAELLAKVPTKATGVFALDAPVEDVSDPDLEALLSRPFALVVRNVDQISDGDVAQNAFLVAEDQDGDLVDELNTTVSNVAALWLGGVGAGTSFTGADAGDGYTYVSLGEEAVEVDLGPGTALDDERFMTVAEADASMNLFLSVEEALKAISETEELPPSEADALEVITSVGITSTEAADDRTHLIARVGIRTP